MNWNRVVFAVKAGAQTTLLLIGLSVISIAIVGLAVYAIYTHTLVSTIIVLLVGVVFFFAIVTGIAYWIADEEFGESGS